MLRRVSVLLAALACLGAAGNSLAEYSEQELQTVASPIALYPDALVTRILRAAAYPWDVSAAAEKPGTDDVAWNDSVRALEPYPDLLQAMAQNPDWTSEIADAVASQEAALMNAVQVLRQRALAAGFLQSGGGQLVDRPGPILSIAPAAPGVIYLPYYDPWAVYGGWRPERRIAAWRRWQAAPHYSTKSIDADAAPERREPHDAERNGPPSPARQLELQSPQAGSRGNGAPSRAQQMERQ